MTAEAAEATTRVLLVDDDATVRAGLRLLISEEADLEVIGEAADGQHGVGMAVRHRPDVVLMDVSMPKLNGLEAAAMIMAKLPASRVLMLTGFDEEEVVVAALRSGASGFLLKSSPPEYLLDAIRHARSPDAAAVAQLIGRLTQAPRRVRRAKELDLLTVRETDVLRLVAHGLSNAEIAAALFLAETTVRTRLGRVLDKLGLRDRSRAIAFAYASGLVVPGDRSGGGRPDG